MEGFIKISRESLDKNFLTRDLERLGWYVDLLRHAAWKDYDKEIQGHLVNLKRGQQAISLRLLQERWAKKDEHGRIIGSKPTLRTVERFLSLLEQCSLIKREKAEHQYTLLTICDYDCYKSESNTLGNTLGNNKEESKKEEVNIKEPILSNRQEKKPAKKHYAEFVTMTEEEYSKLVLQFGQEQTTWMINKLDNYKGSRGKAYKSDYRAILSWVAKEYESNKNQTRQVNYGAEYANNAIGREAAREAAREQRRKEAYEWIANEINRCNAV